MVVTEFYRDFYGCTASVKHSDTQAILTIRSPYGEIIKKKSYSTRRGAVIALGRASDCWKFTGQTSTGKIKL